MECSQCKKEADYECKACKISICENCVIGHVEAIEGPHDIVESSIAGSVVKCDACKANIAKLCCLCQDEKKKFCEECIKPHLEIVSTHCVEAFEGQAISKESLRYQEKRRKIELVMYEIGKNYEALKEFKAKLGKTKEQALSGIESAGEDAKHQINRVKTQLEDIYKDVMLNRNTESSSETLINKIDLNQVDKELDMIDIKIQTDVVLRALDSMCKMSIIGK